MRTDIKEDGENGKRTWTLTTVVFPWEPSKRMEKMTRLWSDKRAVVALMTGNQKIHGKVLRLCNVNTTEMFEDQPLTLSWHMPTMKGNG
jgi:hypothetical protein